MKERIIVRISRNYPFPDLLRQTPESKGVWGNVVFTEDDIDEVDFLIILNKPAKNLKVKALSGGTWLFVQEPPYLSKAYHQLHFRFVDKVFSGFDSSIPNNFNEQAGLPWHINKSYDQLINLKSDELVKVDKISWITSNTNNVPGHKPRLNFIDYLNSINFGYDLYGRGYKSIDDKLEGLEQYKYSIAVENYSSHDYFTEKAIDCFLSWTMPIYYGCTNFQKYFPPESYISIDINKPEEAVEIMSKALADKLWEKNIEAIAESRRLILNKYQLFPMVVDKVNRFMLQNPNERKKKYFIPQSGLTRSEETKKILKSILRLK